MKTLTLTSKFFENDPNQVSAFLKAIQGNEIIYPYPKVYFVGFFQKKFVVFHESSHYYKPKTASEVAFYVDKDFNVDWSCFFDWSNQSLEKFIDCVGGISVLNLEYLSQLKGVTIEEVEE